MNCSNLPAYSAFLHVPLSFTPSYTEHMENLIIFVNTLGSNGSFQLKLFALLASLLMSLRICNTLPYFIASGSCLLLTASVVLFDLFASTLSAFTVAEASATTAFISLVLVSFAFALFKSDEMRVLSIHAATSLGFTAFFGLQMICIWKDVMRPVDFDVWQTNVLPPRRYSV